MTAISKGKDNPQNPTVIEAARPVATLGVIGQKSAEAIVVKHSP